MAFDRKAYMKEYNKNYRSADEYKIKQKAYMREYQSTNEYKESQKIYMKEYRSTDEYIENRREYRKTEKYKEYMRMYGKEYQKTNKFKEYQLEYQRKKYITDPSYKISRNLRLRLREALKGNCKIGSATEDLGCSIEELKFHLEKQFYNNPETNEEMNWENYGFYGWHIDHIIPLSSFDLTDRKQFIKACHYNNLQPLWAKENLSKGAKIGE